jgi:hypothetical protein
MSDRTKFPLKIALKAIHFETGETLFASQQKIFTSTPFKIDRENGLLHLYLKIYKHFPVFMTHPECTIFKSFVMYWGIHPVTGQAQYLLKTSRDEPNTSPPATQQPDGSFSIEYTLIVCPPSAPITQLLTVHISPLEILQ